MTRAVDQPPALSEERAAEDMLHAVRRADWRFLLPDPQLDDVAYVAPHDARAERRAGPVARSVALLDGGDDARGRTTSWWPPRARRGRARAGRADAPGGWVYVETTGRASARWARALRREGPRGGRRDLAVAQRRRAARDGAAARRRRSAPCARAPGPRRAPARARVARAGPAGRRALPLVVPAAAVVGRRPERGSRETS
jgi:hypothetical protein